MDHKVVEALQRSLPQVQPVPGGLGSYTTSASLQQQYIADVKYAEVRMVVRADQRPRSCPQ